MRNHHPDSLRRRLGVSCTRRARESAELFLATEWFVGFIDAGATGCQPLGSMAPSFLEGLAPVKQGDKWGYIDRKGSGDFPSFSWVKILRVSISNDTPRGRFTARGVRSSMKDWRRSKFDRKHEYMTRREKSSSGGIDAAEDSPAHARVRVGEEWVTIDKSGMSGFGRSLTMPRFLEGMAGKASRIREWGYIDDTGKLVLDYQFRIATFKEVCAWVEAQGAERIH